MGFAAVLIVLTFLMMIYDVMFLPLDPDSSWLPKASRGTAMHRALREDAIHVAILRDGMIFLGNRSSMEKTSLEELKRQLPNRIAAGAERKVYILTDARTRYIAVMAVLDTIRDAGIEDVGFMVQQTKPATP